MLRFSLLILLFLAATSTIRSQESEQAIRELLSNQSDAWNRGDIDDFMAGYLESGDLHFLGKNGLTSGWTATRDRYQKAYPDTAAMGKLRFELHEITRRTNDVYTIIGRYFLKRRTLEDLDGYFLLVTIRTEDGWKIAADSTH